MQTSPRQALRNYLREAKQSDPSNFDLSDSGALRGQRTVQLASNNQLSKQHLPVPKNVKPYQFSSMLPTVEEPICVLRIEVDG